MSVYVWGKSDQGQLGIGESDELFQLDPILLEGRMGAVRKLACGDAHCLAVNEFGDVFAWGRGRSGQLGDGKRKPIQKTPQKVEALDSERIVDVCCGSHHSLAVTQHGKVYQWGACHRFTGSTPNFSEKVQMPGMGEWSDKKQKLIESSLALYLAAQCPTVDQASDEVTYLSPEVANFGAFVSTDDLFPQLVPSLEHEKIISVCAGYSFSLAVAESGHLYSWGFNEKRQLGLLHRFNQEKPVLVATLANLGVKIVKACCGQQHVLALSSDGAVYSWGLGVLGQLGHGDCVDSGLPRPIQFFQGQKVVDIAAGSHHSVVVTAEGKVYTFGSSEYGQLGGETDAEDWQTAYSHLHGVRAYLGATPQLLPLDFVSLPVKVASGDLHTIVICENGEIYTFGWGLNGALGHGDRKFQHFPRLVARLKGEKVVCVDATSHSTIVATASCPSLFAADFKPFVNNPLFSDLTFIIKNRQIQAHKAIVFPRCPALNLLYGANIEQGTNSITINDEDFHIFNALIKYLYLDQLPGVPLHHIPKLKKLAYKYSLPHLIYLCTKMSFNSSLPGNQPLEVVPSSFANDLGFALLKGNDYSDVRLVLPDGDTICAHRVILAARSDYFKTLFEGSFQDAKNPIVNIGELEGITLRAILNFIYTDKVTLKLNGQVNKGEEEQFAISSDCIVDVLLASGRFLLSGLRQKIERELEDNLNLDIVTDLLLVSEVAQTPKLKKECLQLVATNQEDLKMLPEYEQFVKAASDTLLKEIDTFKKSL